MSRRLELLELLQTRPLATGAEIADRLGVDRRTVRRDVAELQRLGIPVEGERGAGGGYRLRPGYRLPPLMLTDAEALAVTVGLTRVGGAGSALEKVRRVLPARLARQVEALADTVGYTDAAAAPLPEAALALAEAVRRGRRVRLTHRGVERELSPHGLVVHGALWYLAAYDHGRAALRTFRLDRVAGVRLEGPATPAPDGFDALDHVTRSLARVPWPHAVEARLELPLEEARRRLPATLAELAADGDGTLLRMRAQDLGWAASVLAGLGCAFTVVAPDELRAALRDVANRLTAA